MADNLFNLNNPDFLGMMIRFVINIFFLFILIRLVYFRYSRKENFMFGLFLMGIMIFFIGSMLKAVFLELGMAIGLFAVFTILRFRTRNFSIKDMSYIFTTIGLSVVNSFKLVGFPMLGIFIINAIVILSAYVLEEYMIKNKPERLTIIYDKLELLSPDKKQRLLKDLSSRSGKNILRVKIRRVNYKRDRAEIDIYFRE